MENKRYIVSLDAYLYAGTDEEAKRKAAILSELIRKIDDNDAQVISLVELPFGSCVSREVHSGDLTIYEDKLIEN